MSSQDVVSHDEIGAARGWRSVLNGLYMEEFLSSFSRLAESFVEDQSISLPRLKGTNCGR